MAITPKNYKTPALVAPTPINSATAGLLLRCAIRYAIQSGSRTAHMLPILLRSEVFANASTDTLTEIFFDMERGLNLSHTDEKHPPLVRKAWLHVRDVLADLIMARNQPIKAEPKPNPKPRKRRPRLPEKT